MKIFIVAAISFGAMTAVHAADFSVELLKPQRGLRQCQVGFNAGVPRKETVDKLMEKALEICAMADPDHDVQVQAFANDDSLPSGKATYTFMVRHTKGGQVEKVTFDQFLKGLKPIH